MNPYLERRIAEIVASDETLRRRIETLQKAANTGLYDTAVAVFIMQAFAQGRLTDIIPTIRLGRDVLKGGSTLKVPIERPLPMAKEVADTGALEVNPADKTITGATSADPVVITAVGHGYASGDLVRIQDVVGTTDLNGNTYRIVRLTADTFSLQNIYGTDIDGSLYGAYVSGGKARLDYGYASADIAFSLWQGYPCRITQPLLEAAAPEMVMNLLGRIGRSLGRRADNLYVTAVRTATPATRENRNYKALGLGTHITWDHLIGPDGIIETMWEEFNANGKLVLAHPSAYYRLLSSSPVPVVQREVKTQSGQPRRVQFIDDIQVVKSNHLNFREVIVLDPDMCGYAVHGDVQPVITSPVTGFLATDIHGTMHLGATVTQPMAAYRIMEDTA